MPGKIKVKILAGRNLPVMDRSGDTTDAYVELKFGNTTYKTDVCRKSLNPQWNSEWYKFEVDDADLQDEPLQIRLMDHDTYSANDAIGKVYINLNPLLLPGVPPTVKNIWTLEAAMNTNTGSQGGSVMTGWIPVYDTMHGIRGEVNIIVKVELFSDFNKFRQSSCGVQFFYSPNIPYGYHTQSIHGFVEELVVSDDPEYKWIDKIRTPRASNEARQTLFFKLSGEVQRKIGLKALDLGGNAVIGYLQNFDLEGESGIVARGIGTAVTLVKSQDIFNLPSDNINVDEVALVYFSQSKSQTERTVINESMPLRPMVPNRTSYPLMSDARFNDSFSCRKISTRSPNRIRRKFEYKYKESKLEKNPQTLKTSESSGRLRKSTTSYSSLSQAVIDDASVRMMLAQEDERGEYGKPRLDVSIKNLKKLFSTESDKSDSNPKLNTAVSKPSSARSSLASIYIPRNEKIFKGEGIAALLIRSIHSEPLENLNETHEDQTSSLTSKADEETHKNLQEKNNSDQTKDSQKVEEKSSKQKNMRDRRRKTRERSNDLDLSFEENTPTSESDVSNENASYDILRDSALSSDEEIGVNNKYGKPLTRAVTFPLTKVKCPRKRLQRLDSDTRPLNEESTLSLAKYLSANHISDIRSCSPLLICPPQISDGKLNKKKDVEIRTDKITKFSELFSSGGKFGENDFTNTFKDNENTDNTPDLPIATSTPIEIRPPFFPVKLQSKPSTSRSSDDQGEDALQQFSEERVKTLNDSQEAFKKQTAEKSDGEKQIVPRLTDEMKTDESKSNFAKSLTENDNKEDSKLSNVETEASAYTVFSDSSEFKEEKGKSDENFPVLVERIESFKNNDATIQMKIQDNSSNTFTTSSHSLPSLSYYPLAEMTEQKHNREKKEITCSVSTVPSSIESLIQSSSNDTLDIMRKDRRKCMLNLIKIIDTKMMTQPINHDNENSRTRRRKREKVYRAVNNPIELQKVSRGYSMKKRLPTAASLDFMRVSSIPNDLSLNASTPLPSRTDSSTSYVSSLESINNRESIIRSRLRTAARSPSSKQSFLGERSAIDPSTSAREIASKVLTLDAQGRDHPRNVSDIEMKVLKPRDTNPLTHLSTTSVGLTIHKSHSVSNVREVSGNDEFTNNTNTANITDNSCVSRPSPDHRHQDEASLSPCYPLPTVSPVVSKICQSPANKPQVSVPLHRRSSDSDLSVTPKGNSLGGSDRSMGGLLKSAAVVRTMNQDALEMLEYPFITMQQYPPGFIIHIGGLVSSRSVKLLERISNLEEPEGRDAWWTEIRMEVRSHARALACNVVIGYKEETSICDDVCVLNASGTAAVINLHNSNQDTDSVFMNKLQGSFTGPIDSDREKTQQKSMTIKIEKNDVDTSSVPSLTQPKVRHLSEGRDHDVFNSSFQTKCNLCHLPYSEASVPFRVNVSKCGICKRAKVPDVMFTTIELPENMPTTGRGCFIQATVCKSKKDLRGELNAKEISDCLPFLEYELHSLLLNKLKVKGMNAIFGLKLQVSVGERLIVGMAVGTAVFLTALPAPATPQIASGNSWHNEDQLADIQKNLVETVKKNREFYRLKPVGDIENGRVNTSDTDESDEDLPDLDFSVGPRDTCVLEVDDIEDMDRISLLIDDRPPDDFHVVNTQSIPGLEDLEIVRNLQMFTQISRAKIPTGQSASMPSKYFARLLQSVYFKLRRMVPCAVCDMQFKLALPEPDEIQFTVVGMALGLGDPVKVNKFKKKPISHSVSKDQVKKSDDSEMIFSLDVDHTETPADNTSNAVLANSSALSGSSGLKSRPRSPLRTKTHTIHRHKHVPLKGRYGVDITPLSYLPGGRIERYLGNLNFFFIRESTSIRENGGLSGFTHSFVMEVLAIVRAHITALGGNAMVAFFMTQCVLLHSPHKNQGQCLINVGGDVVSVSYFADEKHSGASNC